MDSQSKAIEEKTPRRAWAILAVTYLASITAPMIQLATPPLADWLFPAFQLNGAQFGLQMSVIGWIGVILAFPAALISRKIGLKATVLISVACIGVGAVGGALTDSFAVFLATRFIEGVGIGFMGVVTPTCVSIWFPNKTRGLALGIWSTWFPFASVIIYAVAPSMATAMGWRSVFYACAILSLVAFIVFALVFKMPKGNSGDAPEESGSFIDSLRLLKNKNIWLLGLCMCAFSFIGAAWANTFYPTYLTAVHGFSPVVASGFISVYTAIGLVVGPLSGAFSDRLALNNKRWLIFAGYIILGIALVFAWPDAGTDGVDSFIWIAIVFGGVASGIITAAIRPLAPIAVGNSAVAAAMGMAMLTFMQQLGLAIGPTAFGAAYEGMGWATTSNVMLLPLCVISLLLLVFVKFKKPSKERDE